MPKPTSAHSRAVAALIASLAFVLLVASPSGASTTNSSTAPPCSGKNLKTDAQINRCLSNAIRELSAQVSNAVTVESRYLGANSRAQDLRLEESAQLSYTKYARAECSAQTNPYATGTIAPIIYGECILSMGHQRLALLRREIAYFKNGGEAGRATSRSRGRIA